MGSSHGPSRPAPELPAAVERYLSERFATEEIERIEQPPWIVFVVQGEGHRLYLAVSHCFLRDRKVTEVGLSLYEHRVAEQMAAEAGRKVVLVRSSGTELHPGTWAILPPA